MSNRFSEIYALFFSIRWLSVINYECKPHFKFFDYILTFHSPLDANRPSNNNTWPSVANTCKKKLKWILAISLKMIALHHIREETKQQHIKRNAKLIRYVSLIKLDDHSSDNPKQKKFLPLSKESPHLSWSVQSKWPMILDIQYHIVIQIFFALMSLFSSFNSAITRLKW